MENVLLLGAFKQSVDFIIWSRCWICPSTCQFGSQYWRLWTQDLHTRANGNQGCSIADTVSCEMSWWTTQARRLQITANSPWLNRDKIQVRFTFTGTENLHSLQLNLATHSPYWSVNSSFILKETTTLACFVQSQVEFLTYQWYRIFWFYVTGGMEILETLTSWSLPAPPSQQPRASPLGQEGPIFEKALLMDQAAEARYRLWMFIFNQILIGFLKIAEAGNLDLKGPNMSLMPMEILLVSALFRCRFLCIWAL
jgi:hypothetical protein